MVNWLKRDKPKQPSQGPSDVTPREVVEPLPVSPLPKFALEPDYGNLTRLQFPRPGLTSAAANVIVVGLGPVGEAVLESLKTWLPSGNSQDESGLQLLVVRCDDAPTAADLRLPKRQAALLRHDERLELPVQRGRSRLAWYTNTNTSAWDRVDSRLGLFQDLQNDPSALWEELRIRMAREGNPDVWLVGSVFDVEGSGLILDFAHLTRLVGRALRYEPYIGWMMALPGSNWGQDRRSQAKATLRELTRLLTPDLPRMYEYNPKSTNSALTQHEAPGVEDASSVFLCEPPKDVRIEEAARSVVDRMALALLTLTQPGVWRNYRDFQKNLRRPEMPCVGAFGVCAHYLQLPELQHVVRTWLARDILIGSTGGAIRPWRESQVSSDRDGAALMLRRSGDTFLETLVQDGQTVLRPSDRQAGSGTVQTFKFALRHYLQVAVDRYPEANGLLASACLLSGVEETLLRANLSAGMREQFDRIIEDARRELTNWRQWLRTTSEQFEATVVNAQDQWETAIRSDVVSGIYGVLGLQTAQHTYERLVNETADLRTTLRQYVRLAWLMQGQRLRLCVDTLFPGYEQGSSIWRHAPEAGQVDSLWQGTMSVVETLTQESTYWPQALSASQAKLPTAEQTEDAIRVTLDFQAGVKRVGYVASGDRQWREQARFPAGADVSAVAMPSSTIGLLLQVHHQIPLHEVGVAVELQAEQTRMRRGLQNTTHIFEAEQLAAQIEAAAFGQGYAYRRQARDDTTAQTILGPKTVAALQWPDRVKEFVFRWIAGIIEPSVELASSAKQQSPSRSTLFVGGQHPLDALFDFMFPRGRVSHSQRSTRTGLTPLPVIEDYEANPRLDAIRDWWQSPEPRNVEWFLLVHGLVNLRN